MRVQKGNNQPVSKHQAASTVDESLRAIAYSMDALIPGLYLWFGSVRLRLGGSLPEETYPGTIHSSVGFAIVLPNYWIYSTYQGRYPC